MFQFIEIRDKQLTHTEFQLFSVFKFAFILKRFPHAYRIYTQTLCYTGWPRKNATFTIANIKETIDYKSN